MQIIMEQKFDPNDSNQEAGEEQLSILIKLAGNDARSRRRETMSRHFEKIRAVINEAKSRQEWMLIK
jgi:fructose-bisphosphate aldolase class 1